ncbi:hypothetical protein Ddc_15827 [Ditylenchus destructor]|nr:hypothetical protein Ddc_15827 [Ditylenchus destructor]
MNGMPEMEHFPQHSQDSEDHPLVRKTDVWSPLSYYTKIDVFKFLRPYDIRKFCVYVNKSWASFCVENQNYIPHPRFVPPRTVEQRFCIDENLAFEQRIIDEYTIRRNAERQKEMNVERDQQKAKKSFLFRCAFSAILLATWTCIVCLIVRINNQSEEDSTDDLLAFCPLMVLSLTMTYRYMKDCCYYNGD